MDKKTIKKLLIIFIFFSILLFIPLFLLIREYSTIIYSLIGSSVLTTIMFSLSKIKNEKLLRLIGKLSLVLGIGFFIFSFSFYLAVAWNLKTYTGATLNDFANILLDFKANKDFFIAESHNFDVFFTLAIKIFFICLFIIFVTYYQTRKNPFFGIENGSARWGRNADRKKFFLHLFSNPQNESLKKFLAFLQNRLDVVKSSSTVNKDLKIREFKTAEENLSNHIKSLKNEIAKNHDIKSSLKAENSEDEEIKKEINQITEDIKKIELDIKNKNFTLSKVRRALDEIKNSTNYDDIKLLENKFELYSSIATQENNFILSSTEFISPKTNINYNQMILGGSGSGKSWRYVKPNIAQLNSNFIVTDPKGELYQDTAKLLEENGYVVKCINLVNPQYSCRYNPFKYINNINEIAQIVSTIISNTENGTSADPFWVKAETNLLSALCYYCFGKYGKDTNIVKIFELLVSIKDNEKTNKISIQDELDEYKLVDPTNPCFSFFSIFMQGQPKLRANVLTSLSTRLSIIANPEIKSLLGNDDLYLDDVECKKAIFVIMSDSNKAYNVIASLFFSQIFQLLYFLADNKYGHLKKKLPLPHQFIFDEFANIGEIYNFSEILATCRGRGIGISIILQDIGQLKIRYKDNFTTIISNCDSFLFLGTNEIETCTYISKMIGTTTFVKKQVSYSKTKSYSYRDQKRELMKPEEIKSMSSDMCIVFIKGISPFFSKKYDVTKHPYYSYLNNEEHKTYPIEQLEIMRENYNQTFIRLLQIYNEKKGKK